MPNLAKNKGDRRVKRTKSHVFDAFFQMVQSQRYDEIKVIHIIEHSGVGKSTFYEHFKGKDDVLSQSLEYPMTVFANALIGEGDQKDTLWMLNHFWERRVFGRVILKPPTRDVVDNCLRNQIMTEIENKYGSKHDDEHFATACLLSSGFLGLLNEWILGRLSLSNKEMFNHISEFSYPKNK